MGVVALERGIPAFFDNSRGQITTRQDEGDAADLPQVLGPLKIAWPFKV